MINKAVITSILVSIAGSVLFEFVIKPKLQEMKK